MSASARASPARRSGWLFVAPATVYLAVFSLLPIAAALWMSLHRWHLLQPQHTFVGWQNYSALLGDPFFRGAMVNTLLYVALSVPMGVAAALAVALLVAQPLRGVGFFRTLYYIPSVSSPVALSMLWIWILLPEVGLINTAAKLLHVDGSTDFLNEPAWALAALALMSVWIGLGPRMVIFLVGLQSIPETLYEAAALDGAGSWSRFRHVTLPCLRPTTLFVIVTTTIAAFQLFTPVAIMTQGGPQRRTDVLLYHIYKEAWQKFEAGSAAAMSFILLAMILLVAWGQFRLMRHGMESAGAA